MMSDLKPITDIVEFNPKRSVKKGTVAPFIEMAALPTSQREVDYILHKELKSGGAKFTNGDTLFARITPCLENGKTAQVFGLKDGENGFGSTEFIVMSPIAPDYDSKFVYYLARHPEFREYARTHMEGTSGRQRVSWQSLAEFKYNFPDKNERKRIGDLLAKLDDKIANNTAMNATLEKIAQRIFKSWFVDFDPVKANAEDVPFDGLSSEIQSLFPNEFEESELGMIPKGWEVKKVTDLANVSSGKRPIVKVDSKNKEMKVPVYGGNGIKWYSNQANMESEFIITGRVGTLGTVFKVFNPCWVSDNALTIIPKEKCDFEFAYQALNLFDIQSLNSGSTQPLVTQTAIKNIPLIFPTNHILREKYNDFATGINRKIHLNNEQNKTLSDIRDKLLPRLISGKITIQKAEELLEEAS